MHDHPRLDPLPSAFVVDSEGRLVAASSSSATNAHDRLLARLQHAATHDQLTGLYNRLGLCQRFAEIDDRVACSLLYLDLDGFKAVNDGFGHAVGDQLLRAVADRLRKNVRVVDTAARVGGDEFVVLVTGCDGESTLVERLRDRLTVCLAEPIHLDRLTATIGISIGTADADPGDTLEALIERADQAMYAVKRARCRSVVPWVPCTV